MRARLNVVIGSVALAAALVSCGGGGPGKAEFTAEADGACSAGNTAISAGENRRVGAKLDAYGLKACGSLGGF